MQLSVRSANSDDIKHLQACLDRDEYHQGQKADDWAMYSRLISFHTEIGPVYHVGLQQDGAERRIHFQHDSTVGKKHLIVAMAKGISWLKDECKKEGTTALIFNSTAPQLIKFFVMHHGFLPDKHNDYKAGL